MHAGEQRLIPGEITVGEKRSESRGRIQRNAATSGCSSNDLTSDANHDSTLGDVCRKSGFLPIAIASHEKANARVHPKTANAYIPLKREIASVPQYFSAFTTNFGIRHGMKRCPEVSKQVPPANSR